MKRLLVTGATGFLGHYLCKHFARKYEVYGVSRSGGCVRGCKKSLALSLAREEEALALIDRVKPDYIIHAAALSQPDICQNDSVESYRSNVIATENLSTIAGKIGIRLIFTSTDMVFDGENPLYSPESCVKPVNLYGAHKALAEELVLSLSPGSLVCRLPLLFGESAPGRVHTIEAATNSLKKGEKLFAFTDQIRTPSSTRAIAEAMEIFLESSVGGILHLGGREILSRWDIIYRLSQFLGVSPDLVVKTSQKEALLGAPRGRDLSLNSESAYSLGFNPLSLEEEFELMGLK